MKYISLAQLREAIELLRPHHSIFATTFFVMKAAGAPIGKKIRFKLDAANEAFLAEQYRIHPKSEFFFRLMRQGNPTKDWNKPDYAGKGLQSVNTRGCPKAFLHDRDADTWGWSDNYTDALKEKLPRGGIKLPLFCVAAWFYRNEAFPENANREDLVRRLIVDYKISDLELRAIFESEVSSSINESDAFQETPVKWFQMLAGYTSPADVPPESSGILGFLEIEGVGPSRELSFDPGSRLNIITGDNGLGKTFLLDLAWWALTQNWIERPAVPAELHSKREATIKFQVGSSATTRPIKVGFSRKTLQWNTPESLPATSGLVVYARVDGSFAICDPVSKVTDGSRGVLASTILKFSRDEVWDGNSQIEGLIRDWTKWQERKDKKSAFDTFANVLARLSPPDLGPLQIGPPVRLPGEIRDIPTLVHSFGNVPFVFESAGIKRIVTLAYLVVWAWEEHKLQSKQRGKPEERKMVILLDEAEAHLHPKWQRVILPAILEIASDLNPELSIQLIVASHSPLVLASSEPIFKEVTDKLFHLDLSPKGEVSFKELSFQSRGTIDSWLASPLFAMKMPGSAKREEAIQSAVSLQNEKSPSADKVQAMHNRLRGLLSAEDPFWVRWLFFAEKNGAVV